MSYCVNCGSEIREGNNFCTQCGTPIRKKVVNEKIEDEKIYTKKSNYKETRNNNISNKEKSYKNDDNVKQQRSEYKKEASKYDITTYLEVSTKELSEGTERELSLKSGEVINVNIPAHTSDGETLKLKGLGKYNNESKKRGDLNLVIKVIDDDYNDYDERVVVKGRQKANQKEESKRRYGLFYDPFVLNYDYIVFISEIDAQNGCVKKVKIPPRKKVMIPINRGVENEQIIDANIDGVIKKVLVIVTNAPINQIDELNKNVSQSSESVPKNFLQHEYIERVSVNGKGRYDVKVPRFFGRKTLVYARGRNDNPGIKVAVTKEDASYYLGYGVDLIAVCLFFYLVYQNYEKFTESASDFFYCLGQFVGLFLIYEILQFIVGNKRWK